MTGYSERRPSAGAESTGERRSERLLSAPGMARVVDLLEARHRRLVLHVVRRRERVRPADLVVRGNDTEDVESVLVDEHLPKLEEAGYIEWDRESGTISKGPRFEEIEPFLELIEDHADDLPPGWP